MFIKTPIQSQLDAEITDALEKLSAMPDKNTKEYGDLVDRISKLHKLKTEERFKLPFSLDTALVVGANIFGILWLARFEKTEVIKAPKAFGMVMKPR